MESNLVQPRHSHLAWSVVVVAGRDRWRLPPPLYPGFDTLGTLEFIGKSGHEHTWFLLNQAIIKREFALSGSEQNPDLTGKDWRQTLGRAFSRTATGPVEAFKQHGADFVIKENLANLVAGMNALTSTPLLEFAVVEREVIARDRQRPIHSAKTRSSR